MKEIKTVALVGLGAIGAYFADRLQPVLGDDLRVIAGGARAVQIPIHAVLVSEEELEQAEDEWVFGIHDGCADLTDIITTAFVLNMDSQLLCRPDCKGVCFRCGKNLNEGPCGCRKEPDSRFAVLQQLLDK